MLKKQLLHPQISRQQKMATIAGLGLHQTDGYEYKRGAEWARGQVYRDRTFLLQAVESYREGDRITCIKQEDYIKFNFWLAGKHTTVLNGYGQYEHQRPEVFVSAGPQEMVKVDYLGPGPCSWVALCVRRGFFSEHMGMDMDGLPARLRDIVAREEAPYTAHSIPLTADLAGAARSVLAASNAVRSNPLYSQSKAIELMCLLISHMSLGDSTDSVLTNYCRLGDRLRAARELLATRYAEPLTLAAIAREVGLSKTSLTAGFRQLFGESVFDYLQKQRMQRACDLLESGGLTIERVAQNVGYPHACNFSTAFRAHFGFAPRALLRRAGKQRSREI